MNRILILVLALLLLATPVVAQDVVPTPIDITDRGDESPAPVSAGSDIGQVVIGVIVIAGMGAGFLLIRQVIDALKISVPQSTLDSITASVIATMRQGLIDNERAVRESPDTFDDIVFGLARVPLEALIGEVERRRIQPIPTPPVPPVVIPPPIPPTHPQPPVVPPPVQHRVTVWEDVFLTFGNKFTWKKVGHEDREIHMPVGWKWMSEEVDYRDASGGFIVPPNIEVKAETGMRINIAHVAGRYKWQREATFLIPVAPCEIYLDYVADIKGDTDPDGYLKLLCYVNGTPLGEYTIRNGPQRQTWVFNGNGTPANVMFEVRAIWASADDHSTLDVKRAGFITGQDAPVPPAIPTTPDVIESDEAMG